MMQTMESAEQRIEDEVRDKLGGSRGSAVLARLKAGPPGQLAN